MTGVPIIFVEVGPYGAQLPCSAKWKRDAAGHYLGLSVVCPCGCGALHWFPIQYASHNDYGSEYYWNENPHHPTLTPMLSVTSPCGWRGILHNGEFERVG